MKSAPALIQTKVLLYLPFFLALFNISLASANPGHENPTPQPAERGKGIKDSELQKTDYRIKTIVIDPGHGGHDPGCSGKDSHEKHLALGVALKLAENIRARHADVKVILTRDSDVFIPLHKRAAIANRNNADLFISIHCNFMPKLSYVKGSETYVMGLHTAEHNLDVAKRENASILLEDNYEKNYDYDPNSPEGHIMLSMFQNVFLEQSIHFAELVESMIETSAQRRSRGVKQAGFVVLKETTMPSVLIETGFLSNADEEQFLRTDEGQQAIADAILKAFTTYRLELESNGEGVTEPVATAPPPNPVQEAAPVLTKSAEPAEKPATQVYAKPMLLNGNTKNVMPKTPEAQPTSPASANEFREPDFTTRRPVNTAPEAASPQREPRIITLHGSPSDSEINVSPSRNVPPASNYDANSIHFYVQMAASKQPLQLDLPQWSNLPYQVEVVIEDNLYKYQVRRLAGFEEAQQARLALQQRGFPDAFIAAYRYGQRISMEEAKRALGME